MRLTQEEGSAEFAEWLLDVGHGRANDDNNMVSIPQHMVVPDAETLFQSIYPNLHCDPPPSSDYFEERILISARNRDVGSSNTELLGHMCGEHYVYPGADTVHATGRSHGQQDLSSVPPEFLRTMEESGLPPASCM